MKWSNYKKGEPLYHVLHIFHTCVLILFQLPYSQLSIKTDLNSWCCLWPLTMNNSGKSVNLMICFSTHRVPDHILHKCFVLLWWINKYNTGEPRFNEPLYSEVLGITNNIFHTSNSVMYGKEPRYNEPSI